MVSHRAGLESRVSSRVSATQLFLSLNLPFTILDYRLPITIYKLQLSRSSAVQNLFRALTVFIFPKNLKLKKVISNHNFDDNFNNLNISCMLVHFRHQISKICNEILCELVNFIQV